MNHSALPGSLCATLLLGTITAFVSVAAHAAVTDNAGGRLATTSSSAADTKPATRQVPPPKQNPKLKRILKAMRNASTRGHPDLFGQFAGMQHLFEGDYAAALKYFKYGARYADKLSQYSIGMLYLKGRGVRQNPATGCAWLALASERKYPKFVKAHHVLCAKLTADQHDQASAVLDKLLPEYGDKVAKPRMTLALADARRALTGSHVGYDFGVISASDVTSSGQVKGGGCDEPVLYIGGVGVPSSCGTYSPALLNPKIYFAARDAQFNPMVTVGALQDVNAPASGDDESKGNEEN